MVAAFAARLPSWIEALDSDVAALRAGDSAARERLATSSHSLAGSAGVFGFAAISRQAQQVEGAIRDHESDGEVAERARRLIELLREQR